jgi:hypothetical protein
MDLVQRVQDVLLRPKETWPVIESEEMTVTGIYKSYALILAAIPAAAQTIGLAFIGVTFMGIRYRTSPVSAVADAILSYGVSLVAPYIIALVVNSLAPRFTSRKNFVSAFKLSAYSWTACWVAGILLVIPSLTWLARLISLYGLYLFYLGLPVCMDTPREKVTVYFLLIVAVGTVLVAFGLSVVALFFLPGALL